MRASNNVCYWKVFKCVSVGQVVAKCEALCKKGIEKEHWLWP